MNAAVNFQQIVLAVEAVEDPEIPITLKDLGVLRSITHNDDCIFIVLRPTKIGCPGKSRMESEIRQACSTFDPNGTVEITWEYEPWNPNDVTLSGQKCLAEYGISVREHERMMCPYCSSNAVSTMGDFGGSICKVPYHCDSCGSTFERLRSVQSAEPVKFLRKVE